MGDDDFAREHEEMIRATALKLARELDLLRVLDDLVAFGFQGLFEARLRFDASKGVPFGGFAYYRVYGAMLDGAQKIGGMPRKTLARVLRAAAELAEQAGEERAQRGTHDEDDAAAGFEALFGTAISTLVLARAAEEERTPETRLLHELERARVRKAVTTLPERERILLLAIYFDERILDDIGPELGLTKSGASRMHTRALGMLRESLTAPS